MWKLWMFRVIIICVPILIRVVFASDESESFDRHKRALLFPQYSTLQTSMCLIAQISSLPSHRVALNIGFQINYNLPYQLPSFYSPVFWARKLSKTSNPLVNFFERFVESDHDVVLDNSTYPQNNFLNSSIDGRDTTELPETTEIVEETTVDDETAEVLERKKRMITFESDLSAGMFYNGIMDVLEISGYHEDCLLKSVCELAKHPLDFEDDNEDVVKEVLHFLLTPSLHQLFDPEKEAEERELYEEAERIGSEGGDCELIYNDCKVSPLYSISKFIQNED